MINNLRAKLAESIDPGEGALAVGPEPDTERTVAPVATSLADLKFPPAALLELIGLVENKTISSSAAQQVFAEMFDTGKSPAVIVREKGLAQVSDTDALAAVVDAVLARYPDEVTKYRAGKESVLGWLMGQVMRETKGKGNPALVRELLAKALGG
mgnify:CR=1 FL=1